MKGCRVYNYDTEIVARIPLGGSGADGDHLTVHAVRQYRGKSRAGDVIIELETVPGSRRIMGPKQAEALRAALAIASKK